MTRENLEAKQGHKGDWRFLRNGMQSAENMSYIDSEITDRQLLKRAVLELANRNKQVPNSFIKHDLQEVFRKVWRISSIIQKFLTLFRVENDLQ